MQLIVISLKLNIRIVTRRCFRLKLIFVKFFSTNNEMWYFDYTYAIKYLGYIRRVSVV